MAKILVKPFVYLTKKSFYLTAVPAYKLYLKIKSKLRGALGLNQKTNLYLLTHRRIIHIMIVALTVIVALTNLQIGETRAETQFSEDILLASLVETEELGMLTEVEAGQAVPQVTSYSESEDFAVESTPGIESQDLQESLKKNLLTTSQDDTSLIKPEIPSSKGVADFQNRQKSIIYIVQEGDNIGIIARKFGLSNNTILWENNLSAYSIIRPGQKLSIPPKDGVRHTVKKNETLIAIVKKYKANLDKVIDQNNLIDADDISIGQKLFIPGGSKAPVYTPRSRLTNFIMPSSAPIVSKTRMLWPTTSKRITQYYHWRHHAIDIGGKKTNPIYAADDGTISLADGRGWNGGYGKYIIIKHGGNKKTLYSHMNKIFVSTGEKVTKGQVIGMMGTTGRSTGVHLHFEVRFGSSRVNPLKYVK